jgi:hypothetical protein
MVDHFRDDLEPVKKKKHGGFEYTCTKCQKNVREAKTIFTSFGKDLCMECWFESDYRAEK